MIEISEKIPKTWVLPSGAYLQRKCLEARGFPRNLTGWKMVTLTFRHDNDGIPTPEIAFEEGKKFFSRFVRKLAAHCGIVRYFWKLELQENGWPHWHFCFQLERGSRLPFPDELGAWPFGMTKVETIRGDGSYLLKYVQKDVGPLPDWVQDFSKRIRWFGTSKGFLEPADTLSPASADGEGKGGKRSCRSLRQLLDAWSRTVKVLGNFGVRVVECSRFVDCLRFSPLAAVACADWNLRRGLRLRLEDMDNFPQCLRIAAASVSVRGPGAASSPVGADAAPPAPRDGARAGACLHKIKSTPLGAERNGETPLTAVTPSQRNELQRGSVVGGGGGEGFVGGFSPSPPPAPNPVQRFPLGGG
jgi:hypothetical protein